MEILGKKLDTKIFKPFKTIEELIQTKNAMRSPPKSNVPINITKKYDKIEISGRLEKKGRLGHDPNIGALSIISFVLRKLGWKNKIVITMHGLCQNMIENNNKFILIANKLGVELEGLKLSVGKNNPLYWDYEYKGEKLGTIFLHIIIENFTKGRAIFENHAGCEKGYFITSKGEQLALEKFSDRESYKEGDKNKIIHIPDLIINDEFRKKIINIEGKKNTLVKKGIKELDNFNSIEELYIRKYYSKYSILRTVVLFGGQENKITEHEVGFLLNSKGNMILGISAPEIFKEAVKHVLDYWSVNEK